MTSEITKPDPTHSRSPQLVRTPIVLQLGASYYSPQTFDGGESYFTTIEELLDSYGNPIKPIWGDDWVEISAGIRSKVNALEIQPLACPVTISFKRKRDGRVWNRREDDYDRYSTNDYFIIRYESEE
jgi:hypothetical protein